MENLIELIGVIVVALAGIITTVTTAVSTVRTKSKFFNNIFSMFDNKIAKIDTTATTKIVVIQKTIEDFINKAVDRITALEEAYNKAEKTAYEQVERLKVLEAENMLFREIIITLAGSNPDFVRKSIASKIKTLNEDFNEDFKDGKKE